MGMMNNVENEMYKLAIIESKIDSDLNKIIKETFIGLEKIKGGLNYLEEWLFKCLDNDINNLLKNYEFNEYIIVLDNNFAIKNTLFDIVASEIHNFDLSDIVGIKEEIMLWWKTNYKNIFNFIKIKPITLKNSKKQFKEYINFVLESNNVDKKYADEDFIDYCSGRFKNDFFDKWDWTDNENILFAKKIISDHYSKK